MPRVTVLVLSWNHAEFIQESIESIVSQDYADFEVLCIDNGSTDSTPELVAQACEQARIPTRFIPNPSNIGIAPAFNQGLAQCDSEFVIGFSGDDRFLPGRISLQANVLSNSAASIGMTWSGVQLIDETGRPLRDASGTPVVDTASILKNQHDQYRNLLKGHRPPAPGVMIRRSALDTVGKFNEEIPVEDYEMWLRMRPQFPFLFVDAVVAEYRRHGTNTTARAKFMAQAMLTSLLAAQERQPGLEADLLAECIRTNQATVARMAAFEALTQRENGIRSTMLNLVRDSRQSPRDRVRAGATAIAPALARHVTARKFPQAFRAAGADVNDS